MTAHEDSPTVVLVHGALIDASVWDGVIDVLDAQGHAAHAATQATAVAAGAGVDR